MEMGSVEKRVGRYVVIALVIIAVVGAVSLQILYYMAGMPDHAIPIHYEKIEIKSSSVTKSTNSYFVTINFVSTGDRKTGVANGKISLYVVVHQGILR